ncbi:alpha/beta hydrolase [Sphingomonas montanisoli]|nr:alpha/beta hydrolase [Sphingomonas montanisoli]
MRPDPIIRGNGAVRFWALLALLTLAGCAGTIRERVFDTQGSARRVVADPVWPGRAPERVAAHTADGLTLRGWYWPAQGGKNDLILFFHGRGGNADLAAKMAEPLIHDGRGLLIADYRGFGDNPGVPKEKRLFRDGDAFAALARRLAPDARLTIFGYSLGSAIAIDQAVKQKPALLVTLGAFARLKSVSPDYAKPFLPDEFDNLAAAQRLSSPWLILHGTADETVPFGNAGRLKAAAAAGAKLIPLDGVGHRADFATLAPMLWRTMDGGLSAD